MRTSSDMAQAYSMVVHLVIIFGGDRQTNRLTDQQTHVDCRFEPFRAIHLLDNQIRGMGLRLTLGGGM